MMEYKGYRGGQLELDDDGYFIGRVLGLDAVITFKGRSPGALKKAFRDSIDDYLDWCQERGKAPEKAYSGRFVVRLDPAVHRKVALASETKGVAMNTWIAETLEEEAKRELG